MTLRDLTHWVHQPATVVVGLLFPVLMVLVFGWMAQHAVLMAIVWPLLLFAVFFPLSVRRYQGLSR